jgi:hypothetical protein
MRENPLEQIISGKRQVVNKREGFIQSENGSLEQQGAPRSTQIPVRHTRFNWKRKIISRSI